jgi:hypothetical protein
MEYIINRLKEASTWAGIAIFFGMFGVDAAIIERITANAPAVITAVASLLAIFAPSVMGNKRDNPVTDHGMVQAPTPPRIG